jgi:hypothetical protein
MVAVLAGVVGRNEARRTVKHSDAQTSVISQSRQTRVCSGVTRFNQRIFDKSVARFVRIIDA